MSSLNYCIRLKEETLQNIKEIAAKKRRKPSEMIRIILEDYVEKVNL